MSTITKERLTKILSETQAVITECNSRGVHGSVEVNARLFENVLMELLRHRAAMLQSFGNSEQLNSPVIPDGWVACSERMPDPDSEFRICAYTPTPHEDVRFRFVPASLFKSVCRDATHWQYMLPPATPQPEVKQ